MKLIVVAAILGVCSAGRLGNSYLPPNQGNNFGSSGSGAGFGGHSGGSQGGNAFGGWSGGAGGYSSGQSQQSGNSFNQGYQGSTRQQSSFEKNAHILKLNNEVNTDSFAYDFETSNGIRADASGVATHGVQSHGSFSYKGDDGQDYSITYTADENGYRPQGAHLPTPPPIPEAILKSLEQNARDAAAGISDDGSYHGEGSNGGQGGYGSGPSQQYNAPSNQYGAPFKPQQPAAPSRQYLTPNSGPKGNGNFNSQSGYQY